MAGMVALGALLYGLMGCKAGVHRLRFSAEPGQINAIEATMSGKLSMEVAGKTVATNIQSQTTAQLQFDTAPLQTFAVTLHYSNFKVQQQLDSIGPNFSAGQPSDSATQLPESILQQVRQVAYRLRMNQQGSIVDVEKNDSLFAAFAKAANVESDTVGMKVLELLKPLMNEQMAKGFLEQAFFVYPDKPVNVGQSWTNTATIQSIFSMKFVSDYELKAITDSSATLSVESRIKQGNNDVLLTGLARAGAPFTQNKLANSPKGIDVAGLKMTAEFSGKQTGTVELDLKKSRIKTCQLRQQVSGDIKIGIFMLPMTLDMTTTYTVSDASKTVAQAIHLQ
jgi:hypothetical protein